MKDKQSRSRGNAYSAPIYQRLPIGYTKLGPTLTVLYNKEGSVYGGYTGLSWQSSKLLLDITDDAHFYISPICLVAGHGPIFGNRSSPDLYTFFGEIQKSFSEEYNLNGNMDTKFGKNYKTGGTTSKEVNHGHIRVTELEVYAVKDGQRQKPNLPTTWRKSAEWGPKLLGSLKEDARVNRASEIWCHLFFAGEYHTGQELVETRKQMTSTSLISNDDADFQHRSKLSNKRTALYLFWTIDKLCDKTDENVSNTFISPTVKEVVEKVSELFKFPRNNIWPIKNYEEKVESDENVNILALLAVRQILFFVEDYLENMKVKQSRGSQKGKAKQAECELFGSDTA
ncbi:hypothetical protein MAR_006920 [Mya arenaria]|uniref:Uncharacterized protein n=1 Tax=Mya arenaria TaxID=6604 RepID=A0ABY7DAV4_MYAAR|nr:hypothetical protein MAR_006920 [Mya arenaria]